MKQYLLDTDIITMFLKGDERVVKKIEVTQAIQLFITVTACSELLYGAGNSKHHKDNLKIINGVISNLNVIQLDLESAKVFAEQKVLLKKQGRTIPDMDLMTVSIAISGNYILVSNNQNYTEIKKLKLENWSEAVS